jgi:hypothetical protein
LKSRSVFVGFSRNRARRISEAIRQSAGFDMQITVADDAGETEAELASRLDAVFVNAEIGWRRLGPWVELVRGNNRSVPIVLTYEQEPDGWAFQIASRHDCWLFSETDRLGRGLNTDELGEALRDRAEAGEVRSRLIDIASCSGPCSTGE